MTSIWMFPLLLLGISLGQISCLNIEDDGTISQELFLRIATDLILEGNRDYLRLASAGRDELHYMQLIEYLKWRGYDMSRYQLWKNYRPENYDEADFPPNFQLLFNRVYGRRNQGFRNGQGQRSGLGGGAQGQGANAGGQGQRANLGSQGQRANLGSQGQRANLGNQGQRGNLGGSQGSSGQGQGVQGRGKFNNGQGAGQRLGQGRFNRFQSQGSSLGFRQGQRNSGGIGGQGGFNRNRFGRFGQGRFRSIKGSSSSEIDFDNDF